MEQYFFLIEISNSFNFFNKKLVIVEYFKSSSFKAATFILKIVLNLLIYSRIFYRTNYDFFNVIHADTFRHISAVILAIA